MKPIMELTHKLRLATDSNVSVFVTVYREKFVIG